MKRASKRVVVTSERINFYGFRVLTDGIELTQYNKNPSMLWMHIRAIGSADTIILPLGNVIELKREFDEELGNVITGLPVFDETDKFAMRIYKKYENGTIRMASAGLIPREWSDEPEYVLAGQRSATLIKSVLQEISLCDIGGNDDALQVALYNDAEERIMLSADGENATIPTIKHPLIISEMEKIQLSAEKAAVLLGLKPNDAPAVYEAKIAEVVQLAQTQKTEIESLTREKSTLNDEVVKLKADVEAEKAVTLAAKIETLVQGAVDARKITADEKAGYVALAQKDFASVETLLNGKVGNPSIKLALESKKTDTDKLTQLTAKTFDELFASDDLGFVKLNASAEYSRIFKDKFGKEPKNA